MKKTTITLFTSLLASLLSAAVTLTGVHAAEVTSLTGVHHAKQDHIAKKTSDDGSTVKIHAELHNHVDKQGNHSIVKVSADHSSMQADARSLRPQRHYTKEKIKKELQFGFFSSLFSRFSALASV